MAWKSYAMLACQRTQHAEAVDAGYAARATAMARRNLFYRSLCARLYGLAHSSLGERQAVIRSREYA